MHECEKLINNKTFPCYCFRRKISQKFLRNSSMSSADATIKNGETNFEIFLEYAYTRDGEKCHEQEIVDGSSGCVVMKMLLITERKPLDDVNVIWQDSAIFKTRLNLFVGELG